MLNLDNFSHISHIHDSHYPEILNRYGKPQELRLTTLPTISDKIWGLKKRKLVIVGGRPSAGKSVVLLQLAADLAYQGKVVFFFSYEMSKEVCYERLLANECEIDNWQLTTGKIKDLLGVQAISNSIMAFERKIKESKLFIFESIGQSLISLKNLVPLHGYRPDAVFIDYGNLVSDLHGKTKKQSFDEFIKGLRALAIKENFCAVMAAQINRGVQNDKGIMRPPTLADLKDTGELEQTADMVFLLHRYWLYNKAEDYNKILIDLAKNRDGRIGDFFCDMFPEYYKIREREKKDKVDDGHV